MPSQASRAASTDRINYINIGLMLVSCAVALYIPFELFLFAYAVLGPAHYLTEISWLHKRGYFTRGEHDYWLLGGLAAALFLTAVWTGQDISQQQPISTASFTFLALGSALVLVLTDRLVPRLLGLAAVAALAFAALNTIGLLVVLVATFVPTLVHVYLFTGFFIIFGALKERSRSGYLAFAVFLLCPLICLLVNPWKHDPGAYAALSYFKNFSPLNMTILGVDTPHTRAEGEFAGQQVFLSHAGLVVMRFIAFAYTYHYLNWFSKTSVIRWHEVGKRRLAAIASLWIALVGVYIYDYSLGFRVLFCLSFMHIYLEFPLNHLSIMGTFRELRSRLGGQRPGPGLERLHNRIDIKHAPTPSSAADVLQRRPQAGV
jgi:hypothetical protein